MLHARLGDAQPQFVASCIEATGGNPLLLRHVLTALVLLVPSVVFMLLIERFLKADVLSKIGA